MSFFKKLANEFEKLDFGSDDKDKRKNEAQPQSSRDYPPQQYAPPQQQYGGGHSPQPQQGYGGYSAPASAAHPPSGPAFQPPAGKPPLPAGWVPQWDEQYQHWFYAEQATGRTQWEAPGFNAGGGGSDTRGHGSSGQPAGGYSGYGGGHNAGGYGGGSHGGGYGGGQHGGEYKEGKKEKKSSGYGGMAMAAGAGLVGGAVLASALHDSDSDDGHRGYAQPPPQDYYPPPAAPAQHAYDSDHSSLNSARERLREAEEDAASSSASSSDQEELEEAREEYAEEYEEEYGSD